MNIRTQQIELFFECGKYKGSVNTANVPHGKGRMKYKDGSIYKGSWVNGKHNGNGLLHFQSGNVYRGQFINGMRQGYGEFFYSQVKEKYVGYWIADQKNGKGEYYFKDGSFFRGKFENDTKNGIGMVTSETMVYTGTWRNGKKHGVFKFKHRKTGITNVVEYCMNQKLSSKKFEEKDLVNIPSQRSNVNNLQLENLPKSRNNKMEYNHFESNQQNHQSPKNNFLPEFPNINDICPNNKSDKFQVDSTIVLKPSTPTRKFNLKRKTKLPTYLSEINEECETKFSQISDTDRKCLLFNLDLQKPNNQNSELTNFQNIFGNSNVCLHQKDLVGNSNRPINMFRARSQVELGGNDLLNQTRSTMDSGTREFDCNFSIMED